MANEAPTEAAGKRSVRRQKFTPYTGPEGLERPEVIDDKGRPRSKGPGDTTVAFVPEKQYAVEDGVLQSYFIGRGGVRKRSVCSLRYDPRDKRLRTPKYQRISSLLESLKKDGIPGA